MEVPQNSGKQAAGTRLPCPSCAGQQTELSKPTVLYKMDILISIQGIFAIEIQNKLNKHTEKLRVYSLLQDGSHQNVPRL